MSKTTKNNLIRLALVLCFYGATALVAGHPFLTAAMVPTGSNINSATPVVPALPTATNSSSSTVTGFTGYYKVLSAASDGTWRSTDGWIISFNNQGQASVIASAGDLPDDVVDVRIVENDILDSSGELIARSLYLVGLTAAETGTTSSSAEASEETSGTASSGETSGTVSDTASSGETSGTGTSETPSNSVTTSNPCTSTYASQTVGCSGSNVNAPPVSVTFPGTPIKPIFDIGVYPTQSWPPPIPEYGGAPVGPFPGGFGTNVFIYPDGHYVVIKITNPYLPRPPRPGNGTLPPLRG